MMFPERVIDMLDGLIGHFYACANCGRREEAPRCIQPMHDSEAGQPAALTK